MIQRVLKMMGYRLAWNVFFSPHGGCETAVLAALAEARRQVRVMAYELTSSPVAVALAAAKDRGVDVQIVLDDDAAMDPRSKMRYLLSLGIACWRDGKHAIMHDKVMVLDERTVITGSFNFTQAAEASNAENLLVIQSPALATKYLGNFALHQGHSIKM